MTIIDARLRPPLKDYLRCNLYRDPKKTQGWSNNFLMKVSPAVEQRDADLLYREMDDAGVTLGVMTGRQSPDMGNVSNDDLMDVVREQPSRFVGIAGVDGNGQTQLAQLLTGVLSPESARWQTGTCAARVWNPAAAPSPCMSTMPGCTPSINTAPTAPSPCS